MTNELTTQVSSPLEIRRAMASHPAVRSALDRDEYAVFLASTEKPFESYDTGALAAEFDKFLGFLAKDIGVRDFGQTERRYIISRLISILPKHYGNLSIKDFKLAFEMTIIGDLDAYFPKNRDGSADRGHYQQFTTEYVCKILNAYKQYRAVVLSKACDALPAKAEPRNPEQEEKAERFTKEGLIAAFRHFKEHGSLPHLSPAAEMLYHRELAAAGLATDVEVTEAEQKEIYHRTLNALARSGNIGDFNDLKQEGHTAESIQFGAYGIARRKAIRDAFARLVKNGTEIENYIKL